MILAVAGSCVAGCGKGTASGTTASLTPSPSAATTTAPAQGTPAPSTTGTATEIHLPATNKWLLVQLDQAELQQLQDAEKEGHRPGLLDPELVVDDFLAQTSGLSVFLHGTKNMSHFANDSVVEVEQDPHALLLHLVQPVQQGKLGIWAVDRYQVAR